MDSQHRAAKCRAQGVSIRFWEAPCSDAVCHLAFRKRSLSFALQGRFWAKLWPQLGLPDSALPKFAFTDGVPRVYDETEDPDTKSAAAPGSKFDKLNWLKASLM